jgi:hypothetical protein
MVRDLAIAQTSRHPQGPGNDTLDVCVIKHANVDKFLRWKSPPEALHNDAARFRRRMGEMPPVVFL